MNFVQALAALARQRLEFQFARVQQLLDRDVDQYAIEWPCTAAAQQAKQCIPGFAVDARVRLSQVAAGGIDQHGVVGEIPVSVTGA